MTLLKKSILLLLLVTSSSGSIFSMKRKFTTDIIPNDEQAEKKLKIAEEHIVPILPHRPLSMVQAQEKYGNDLDSLEAAKNDIIRYYEVIVEDDLTAFEQEIDDICREAHGYFASQVMLDALKNSSKPYAVIIDVDETVLSNYELSKECNFGSQKGDAMQFRKEMRCTAIKPSNSFCQELKHLGYKLIYISSRRGSLTKETGQNLLREKFGVDELFLMPMDLYNAKAPAGKWKESVREKLSGTYTIVACIGDSPSDFEGDYTGDKKILFPNYLYKA